jgi:hypothetical protein
MTAAAAASQGSPSVPADGRQQQSCFPEAASVDAAAAAVGHVHKQVADMQAANGPIAAAVAAAAAVGPGGDDGWPLLPDADNLLVVGKALVQVRVACNW